MTEEKFPETKTRGDYVLAVVRSAAGAIPLGGTAVSEIINAVFTPPLLERQRQWFNGLDDRIKRLESEWGITPEQLRDNPAFIDAVLEATQAALRTSSKERLQALRNVVLNAALPSSPELTIQQIFVALTERLSDLHIRLLRFAQDAKKFAPPGNRPRMSQATDVLLVAFPDAGTNEALYKLVWADLFAAGLVKLPNLENGYEGDAWEIGRTSELGDRYLAFISDPT